MEHSTVMSLLLHYIVTTLKKAIERFKKIHHQDIMTWCVNISKNSNLLCNRPRPLLHHRASLTWTVRWTRGCSLWKLSGLQNNKLCITSIIRSIKEYKWKLTEASLILPSPAASLAILLIIGETLVGPYSWIFGRQFWYASTTPWISAHRKHSTKKSNMNTVVYTWL